MRIALLLAFGGCVSSEPVRQGDATIELDGDARGVATYRVVSGTHEQNCGHGEHYTPTRDAQVLFGPIGGDAVALGETTAGTYTATAPTVIAAAYQFSVDGEVFQLPAPPTFSATIKSISNAQAMIELSDASTTSYVVVRSPNGHEAGYTLFGSPALIEADFSQRGDYRIAVARSVESDAGIVEIRQRATLTMP